MHAGGGRAPHVQAALDADGFEPEDNESGVDSSDDDILDMVEGPDGSPLDDDT